MNEDAREPKPEVTTAIKSVELFYSVLKSLRNFAEAEVTGVVRNLIAPTERDNCFRGLYYRADSNVASMLDLKHTKHFQALIMLARSLFELAVDVRLIDVVPNSIPKLVHVTKFEKLRAAEKLIRWEDAHGLTPSVSPKRDFVKAEKAGILAKASTLWDVKELKSLKHWSALKLNERAEKLDAQFQEFYHRHYAPLSWNAHAGLTGIDYLKPETFIYLCAQAYQLASQVYREILEGTIKEFQLAKNDPNILDRMKCAELMPTTKTQADIEQLKRDLGL